MTSEALVVDVSRDWAAACDVLHVSDGQRQAPRAVIQRSGLASALMTECLRMRAMSKMPWNSILGTCWPPKHRPGDGSDESGRGRVGRGRPNQGGG